MIDKAKIFVSYGVFFLLLFLQFPLSGSIPGKTDCWWHLAIFCDFENRLSALLHHWAITTSYFPAKALWLYGEPSFGVGALYIIIHALVPDFIWSFYFLYVLLFSMTAFAFFLLAGQFVTARLPRFAGGLFFTCSNYFLGHLDHHNTFFWAIAMFSILCFYHFINTIRVRWLYLAFILWGIQIFFSTTIFIYLSIWLFVLLILHFNVCARLWYHIIAGGGVLILFVLPLLMLYVFDPEIKNAYNPALFANGNVMSNLWPRDLIRFLPGNMIYPAQSDINFDLLYNIKCAAPGIVLFTLFLSGTWFLPRRTFLLIASIGLILALGSEIRFGSWSVPMPMKIYYSHFPHFPFLRTPIRAYFMVQWVLCMSAVWGLSKLKGTPNKRLIITGLIVAAFLFENVPMRLSASRADDLITESDQLSMFLLKQGNGNILHLPSELFPQFPIEKNSHDMNVIGREYLYSFMQTVYKRNTINGSAGYIPQKRIAIDEVLKLRSKDKFHDLLQEYNIKFVILHQDLMIKEEYPLTDSLSQMPFLHLKGKIGGAFVFSVE